MSKKRTISPLHGPVTESFLKEVEEYRFHFCCEECTNFDDKTELCAHGYPNEQHRTAYYRDSAAEGRTLVFCREFELE